MAPYPNLVTHEKQNTYSQGWSKIIVSLANVALWTEDSLLWSSLPVISVKQVDVFIIVATQQLYKIIK